MRPIDADVLLDIAKNKYHDIVAGRYPFNIVVYDLVQIIEEQPTLDLAPVVHGEWIKQKNGRLICSVCGVRGLQESDELDYYYYPSAYCPNCGAKMDGGKTDGCL